MLLQESLLFEGELVVQTALVTKLDEFLLDGFANGHAQRLALHPCQVLLLAGGVDTLSTGCLGGATQSTQNVTGGMSEGVQSAKEFGVDHKEEVAQVVPWQPDQTCQSSFIPVEAAMAPQRRTAVTSGLVSINPPAITGILPLL